jgi:hypothetical protein
MPLELNERGILPVAVHDADLAEVQTLFGGFQRSDRRIRLFDKLKEYIGELRQAEIRGWLIVDGSFVMRCVDEPEDIDVILVLPADWDLSAELRPFQYNLLSKRHVKRRYPIEVFLAVDGSETEKDWTAFFQQINIKWCRESGFENGSQKGLARIAL